MEQSIRNAIWEMLASDYDAEQIKNTFNLIDIEELIEEVAEDFEREE